MQSYTKVAIPNGFEVTLASGYQFRVVKHFQTRRSKTHRGWDVLTLLNGEWQQLPYFSHFRTLEQALSGRI